MNDGAREYHLMIFNRWGEVIWESADRNEEWYCKYGTNTYHNGVPYDNRKDVPQGVYAYYLEITSWNNEQYKYTGTVTLTR